MSLINWIDFSLLGDDRGSLVALEANINIPFTIERVYYIFDTKQGVGRGFHAHKNLKQIAVCVNGKCRFVLDNGKEQQEVWLESPTKGLFIDDMVWHEMYDFSEDCVLLVLANEHYDEGDYIRDYDEFLEVLKNGVVSRR